MKRHRDQPSTWHVVATGFALFYLREMTKGCMNALAQMPEGISKFLVSLIGFGRAGSAVFLCRELYRQWRLFREWKRR